MKELMYPNDIVAFNIFAATMIGKILILNYQPDVTYDNDMGKEYLEDVIAGDVIHIGTKWHKLSPIERLNEKMKRKALEKRRRIA